MASEPRCTVRRSRPGEADAGRELQPRAGGGQQVVRRRRACLQPVEEGGERVLAGVLDDHVPVTVAGEHPEAVAHHRGHPQVAVGVEGEPVHEAAGAQPVGAEHLSVAQRPVGPDREAQDAGLHRLGDVQVSLLGVQRASLVA